MPDPLSAKLIDALAKAVAQETITGLKGKLSRAKKYDLFGTALQTYVGRMEERYNRMRILGMREPIPLRNIYVRANILEEVTAQDQQTVAELEERFQRDTRRIGQIRETKEGVEVVKSLDKIMVLGKPGAGKTTFLRYVTLLALDGKLTENRLPIFVSLKEWADSGKPLLAYIVAEFAICGLADALPYIAHNLTKGRGLLLLDGLDEVTGNIDWALKEIRDFTDQYSQNQFILSCRIAANKYVFEQFTEVEMADFNDEQTQTFIMNWFAGDEKTAVECWEEISQAGNAPIKELAAIPLLLALLCITYSKRLVFPSSRAELYKEAIDTLLKEWDASRLIRREEAYHKLSLTRKENLLSSLAYQTFRAGHYFIPQRDVERQIAAYIQHFPDTQADMLDLDSAAILQSIEAQHGLVVERAHGIYSFSHLTVQEYFTAKYIVDNPKKLSLPALVERHFLNGKWREVWLLTTGMLADAEELISAMHQQVTDRGSRPGVARYLQKADALIVKRAGSLPLDESRVWATTLPMIIALALAGARAGALALAGARAGARADARTLAGARADARADARARDLAGDLAFARAGAPAPDAVEALVIEILSPGESDVSSFSVADFVALADYLHSWEMLTLCLNTECYVSTETRQRIMDSFLQPPAPG